MLARDVGISRAISGILELQRAPSVCRMKSNVSVNWSNSASRRHAKARSIKDPHCSPSAFCAYRAAAGFEAIVPRCGVFSARHIVRME